MCRVHSLSFAWPGVACPGAGSEGPDWAAPLFALGHGLSYAKPGYVAQLPVNKTPICGEVTALPIFNLTDAPTFALHVATADAEHALGSDLNATLEWPRDKSALRVRTVQVNIQQDAKHVAWLAPARLFSRSSMRHNLNAFASRSAEHTSELQSLMRN